MKAAACRERPPPEWDADTGILYPAEFVIPIKGVCMAFGLRHSWKPENDEVKVCDYCGAEWWSIAEQTQVE